VICETCKGKPFRVLVVITDRSGEPKPVALAERPCPDCGGCGLPNPLSPRRH
jgi:DnaJ-class molecular chaperone